MPVTGPSPMVMKMFTTTWNMIIVPIPITTRASKSVRACGATCRSRAISSAETQHHKDASDEAGLLPQGAEDEIRVLLRNEAQFGQLPLHQSRAEQTAGSDPHRALKQVISPTEWIL